jgi:hypothetical protein
MRSTPGVDPTKFLSSEAITDGTRMPRLDFDATQASPKRLLDGPSGNLLQPRGNLSIAISTMASSGTSMTTFNRVRG